MSTKTGGGGHIQENYDPNTGRYVGSDKSDIGLEKYHSGSGLSNQQLIDNLKSGQYGQEMLDIFNSGDSETQSDLIEYLHSLYDEQNTLVEENQRFTDMDIPEYKQFQNQAISNSGLTSDDLDAIRHYVGTSSTSFYLNTAMRSGYQEMLKQFMAVKGYDPNTIPGDYLSEPEVERFKKAMEKATHSIQAPRDMRVDRYVGSGPIVSWFKNTGILDGLAFEQGSWHERLADGYSLQDVADRLSNAIGMVLPKDGSFLSFSACPKLTYMGKKEGKGFKPFLMKIDVPKGQNMHITHNTHESEGMFPNDISFYLKDVKVETGEDGKERVVMYYGIKR